MAEQTFRSPGFFEREIDLTQRTTEIVGVPAGVIGTAQKGPAFVPVTVGSFLDFENKFGSLDPEKFGTYAAHEWLKNRTALTYVRVLGAGANSTTTDISNTQTVGTVKNAGFKLSGSRSDSDNRYNGTVQFLAAKHNPPDNEAFGMPLFTDNQSVNAAGDVHLIRAMLMTASGSRFEVLDHDAFYTGTTTADDTAKIRSFDGTPEQGMFKLVLSSAAGSNFSSDESKAGIKIYTASLDPDSKHYIGKILNTNPDRFNEEQHYLYADFPVEDELARIEYNVSAAAVGILSGSASILAGAGGAGTSFTELFGSFNTRYQTAKTTSFISQPFGDVEYDLFHFEALDDGASGNKRVKVSISNLRRSTNEKDPFGTFTVLVRDYTDTDTDMKILEQFADCTLNPGDENYVGSKIGDYKVFYNFDAETESERRLNITGKRPNRSAFVRIIMHPDVEDREIPKTALPFGFRGLPVVKTTNSLSDNTNVVGEGSSNLNAARLSFVPGADVDKVLSSSIMPPVPMRFKATRGAVGTGGVWTGENGTLEIADARYFFGIKFERVPSENIVTNAVLKANGSGERNKLIDSYSKLLGILKLDTLVTGSGADDFNNNKFSLSKVALYNQPASADQDLDSAITDTITGSVSEHMVQAAYIRNGSILKPRYTIKDDGTGNLERLTFGSLVAGSSAITFNRFSEYMKFTNMLYGGYDGLNLLDKDQRKMNDKAASIDGGGKAAGDATGYVGLSPDSSPGAGKENNTVSSYRTAARIITDPFASRVNIVAIPGIRDTYVTDYTSDLTKEYSKAIYLMDIKDYDDTPTRLYDDSSTRPNVRKTIENFEGRAIDNNYVATYYPDVIIEDASTGESVTVPPSVVALGALGYNDKVAYPWFAPAGFNRGALSSVLNTEVRLTTEDRNIMYEARINPIANFPDGGFVIFGQKTLQQAKSALDRVNVRRMLLEVKRIVSEIANGLIFEQNTPATRSRFIQLVKPKLAAIQGNQGIDSFKIVMNSSNNTAEDAEQNRLNGRIILVPTRAVEFIAMDFIITNSGVSFE